ncbi:hypothetical protein KUF54_14010 [Comamonas sp. Y33R10-2]|uniref:hypothetical protein n=1 Tax=Comamonas sp. Y33R10-2 TaxID=2853257 RepID=UPI001C5CA21D|nr:hypothetical protein [Comamonas sp. Y33R10-2]QXZ09127.1 hypothetical protein KUF54_14010 [Comamonas sp. Y33R10-2]
MSHTLIKNLSQAETTKAMLPPSHLAQRELTASDLESALALHLRCTQNWSETLVRKESLASLQSLLLRSHMSGLFDQDELVAYSVLQHDLQEHQELPPSIAVDPQRPQLMLAGVSVAPEWQGLGLQRRLIMQRMSQAGPQCLLFSTAAPANWHSWNNLLACGFHVRDIGEHYGGHLRYLMVLEPLPEHALYPDFSKEIHALDIKRQQELLSQGWRGAQPGHSIEYMRYVPTASQRIRI